MKKDLDLLGLTWDEALDLTKDRSEWRDCTARCASTAGGRTKVSTGYQKVTSILVSGELHPLTPNQALCVWTLLGTPLPVPPRPARSLYIVIQHENEMTYKYTYCCQSSFIIRDNALQSVDPVLHIFGSA